MRGCGHVEMVQVPEKMLWSVARAGLSPLMAQKSPSLAWPGGQVPVHPSERVLMLEQHADGCRIPIPATLA